MDDVLKNRPLDLRYEEFLFTEIGAQENGMRMSMASALTRLGLDPWDEARRLAALPSSAAISALTQMIARVTELTSISLEIPKLVDLLSKGGGTSVAAARAPTATLPQLDARWLAVLCAIGLVVAVSKLFLSGYLPSL